MCFELSGGGHNYIPVSIYAEIFVFIGEAYQNIFIPLFFESRMISGFQIF